YNIGNKKLLQSNKIRDRKFAAIRYFNTSFTEMPYQWQDEYNRLYNNKEGVLAQFTLFRQNYYRTKFIYGFGVTEDLPYGYNLSLVGGWYRQKDLERPYMGISADRYVITGSKSFFRYYIKAGSFLYRNKLQD